MFKGRIAARYISWRDGLLSRPRLRNTLLLAALGAFVLLTVVSGRRLAQEHLSIHWVYFVIVFFVGAPLTATFNALEYSLTAKSGHAFEGFISSFKITLMSSVANFLPIPGSAMVRTKALTRTGTQTTRAVTLVVVTGFFWIGVSFFMAGFMLLLSSHSHGFALVALLVGTILLLAAMTTLYRFDKERVWWLSIRFIAVELGSVGVSTMRYFVVLRGIGVHASIAQCAALTISTVIASSVGFFPGGLGLRESIAASIGVLVRLPAAVGVVSSAVDRLIDAIFLTLVAIVVLIQGHMRPAAQPQSVDV